MRGTSDLMMLREAAPRRATPLLAIVLGMVATGCGTSTPRVPSPTVSSAGVTPTSRVHVSEGEGLHLTGVITGDVAAAVSEQCPAADEPSLLLYFSVAGWGRYLAVSDLGPPLTPGRYDISDATQFTVALMDRLHPLPTPLPAHTLGPPPWLQARTGSFEVNPDRRSGTLQADLYDATAALTSRGRVPVVEHIQGSWAC